MSWRHNFRQAYILNYCIMVILHLISKMYNHENKGVLGYSSRMFFNDSLGFNVVWNHNKSLMSLGGSCDLKKYELNAHAFYFMGRILLPTNS